MATEFGLACNKPQTVVTGGKSSCSLRRWVLLKNSIIRSHLVAPNSALHEADADPVYRHAVEEQMLEEEEQDIFSFPDPHSLHDDNSSSTGNDEREWLDHVLEELEDDDDEVKLDDHISVTSVSPHDDAAEPLSPLYSPMSSSDDLADQSSFYSYPMPYPPVSPPVIPTWFEPHILSHPVSTSLPTLYDSPLPYFAVDELEDSPVPDAIEDTSDDESDAPSTPSTTSTSSLAPMSSTSPSIPPQRMRFLSGPQVYVETDDSYFYPFGLDPLPFPDAQHFSTESARVVRPSTYQEC